ncbi:conserved protein, unknown function [Hepatocystis sp. ex Piliocolobus tephrosceles]|nr:conserved protein, unknown function [Hepatocystis sp. ex Piliocolobus tephrosceles]
MLLNIDLSFFLKSCQNMQTRMLPMLLNPIYLLRPRKKTQRVDRCKTKKQYKNRRHFKGYYYRWMGSY